MRFALGFTPVVPPLSTRICPWECNRELNKRRKEIERLFRRLKGVRRIFSRFEKLDSLFLGFISLALILDTMRSCEQALVGRTRHPPRRVCGSSARTVDANA